MEEETRRFLCRRAASVLSCPLTDQVNERLILISVGLVAELIEDRIFGRLRIFLLVTEGEEYLIRGFLKTDDLPAAGPGGACCDVNFRPAVRDQGNLILDHQIAKALCALQPPSAVTCFGVLHARLVAAREHKLRIPEKPLELPPDAFPIQTFQLQHMLKNDHFFSLSETRAGIFPPGLHAFFQPLAVSGHHKGRRKVDGAHKEIADSEELSPLRISERKPQASEKIIHRDNRDKRRIHKGGKKAVHKSRNDRDERLRKQHVHVALKAAEAE